MADQLKFIVLSDLHLGESDSLLTPRKSGDYQVVRALSDCLSDFLENFNQEELPAFVLNGDILGLSFSTYQESLAVFEQFLKAFTHQNRICDRVVYVPGNHDHHIWNLAKEENFLKALKKRTANEAVPELQNTSKPLYEDGFSSSFFQPFMKNKDSSPVELKVLYPNFLILPHAPNEPFVLFHHGHFAEDTYHFVTKAMKALYPELPKPKNLESLEYENGAWIDFAFSQLGRSGKAGTYFEELMATLSNEKKLEENIGELSKNLASAINFPYLPMDWMEKTLAKTLLKNIAKEVRTERYKGNTTCSDETMKGLMHYINAYCSEMLEEYDWQDREITMVWSHTHKPFEKITQTEKFDRILLMNTGGWVIPSEPVSKIGASIFLINQKNEVQALRIYNDGKNGGDMKFTISFAEGAVETPFSAQIMECLYGNVDELRPVWAEFKTLLQEEINARRERTHG